MVNESFTFVNFTLVAARYAAVCPARIVRGPRQNEGLRVLKITLRSARTFF